jgi:hypothetical protein
MDCPAFLPRLVGRSARILRHHVESAADPRIRAEQVDGTELLFGFIDDMENIGFLADIAGERCAANGVRDGLGPRAVEIGDHNLGRAFAMENFSKRLADAIRAAGDDNDFSCNFHADVLGAKRGQRQSGHDQDQIEHRGIVQPAANSTKECQIAF